MKRQRNRRNAADTVDVSLERGQVATLVVGSVLALGAVFLLGVGMGRRLSTAPGAPPGAVATRAATPAATPPAAPAVKVPPLTFHDALTRRRVGDVAPAAPAEHRAPPRRPAPKVAAAAHRPAPRVADAAPAVPAKAAPKAPAKAGAGYSIQVASSRDQGDTDRLVKKLVAAGYDARVAPVDIPGRGRWYRVKVGHFPSRESASLKQAEIKVAVNLSGIVVPD